MTLSFVLLDLGLTGQALRQAARAAGDLDGVARARLQAQQGLILQRAGRFEDALRTYGQAVPQLRAHGDELWESRARSNRGVLHAYRGDLAAAEADLIRAQALENAAGRDIDAAMSLWNLGCLARERGDVLLALERFDAADPVCDAQGVMVGQRLVDRATLLLSVGVVGEARQVADRARAALVAAGQAADLLECEALLARVALLDSDPAAAVTHARACRRAARRQARPGWLLVARHLEVLGLEAQGGCGPALVRRAFAVADALELARWPEAAANARLAAARIAAAGGRPRLALDLLDASTAGAPGGSATLRVRYWHAMATARWQAGDGRGAAHAVRAGLTVLARHRAGIGASDLQAHLPAIGEDLARVGLRVALAEGSPRRLLRELERWRGQDLRSRPVRPPRDPELSAALERVRRASSDLHAASVEGAPVERLESDLIARELDVVRLSRRSRAGAWRPPPPPPGIDELRQALGDRVLVEYAAVDEQLVAVTLRGEHASPAHRGPRLHRLTPLAAVRDDLTHLQFALARLAAGRGSTTALQAALRGAQESAACLDAALLGPLAEELTGSATVIVPTEGLHAVPWSLLRTVGNRPVHLVRSGTAWLAAREHRARAATDVMGPEVRVTGPGVTAAPRLSQPGLGGTTVVCLDGLHATAARTLSLLDGAATAHIAAHGTFRADNPLLSCLRLFDGPLMVYDLDGLDRPPTLVVLAACHCATAQVLPGNQLLGVAQALLTMGSAGVVATTLPTPDAETAILMDALHGHLGAGIEVGQALHKARQELDVGTPAGYATSAGFDLYGC